MKLNIELNTFEFLSHSLHRCIVQSRPALSTKPKVYSMLLAIHMYGKRHVLQVISLPLKHAFMSSCRDIFLRHEGHVLRTCLGSFFWRLWKTCPAKTLPTKQLSGRLMPSTSIWVHCGSFVRARGLPFVLHN